MCVIVYYFNLLIHIARYGIPGTLWYFTYVLDMLCAIHRMYTGEFCFLFIFVLLSAQPQPLPLPPPPPAAAQKRRIWCFDNFFGGWSWVSSLET